MAKFTVGSLFAGIGGICLGFKQAGYSVLWAVEFDKYACTTYRSNWSDVLLLEEDITFIDPKNLETVDVITSGFPCQAFSIAGLQKGFKDPRGNLFFETVRFIDLLRPKAFLLENVRNLKNHDGGNTFNTIRNVITADLGYTFDYAVLNSCVHGGIPQNRERIFIVGFKEGTLGYKTYKNPWCGVQCYTFPGAIKLETSFRDLLEHRVANKYYFEENHKYMPILKKSITDSNTLYQWRRVYVRENKKGLCPTLTANMGMGGHNVPLLLDGSRIRRLTPRECARLQGFPEDFVLPVLADSHLYKQIGNSVTVKLVNRIALGIKPFLEECSNERVNNIEGDYGSV